MLYFNFQFSIEIEFPKCYFNTIVCPQKVIFDTQFVIIIMPFNTQYVILNAQKVMLVLQHNSIIEGCSDPKH